MKFKKSATILGTVTLGCLGLSMVTTGNTKAANVESNTLMTNNIGVTNYIDKKPVTVTQINKQFVDFSKEAERLASQSKDTYQAQMTQLLTRYNGATLSLNTTDNMIGFNRFQSDIKIQVAKGDINIIGNSLEGLANLRTAFHDMGYYAYFFDELSDIKSNNDVSLNTRSLAPYLTSYIKPMTNSSSERLTTIGDMYQSIIAEGNSQGGVRITTDSQQVIN